MGKKIVISFLVLTAVSLVTGLSAFAAITGSVHDFSGETWNTGGQICAVCHTPHSASSALSAPLWNHAVTTATFTPYSSSTLNATVGQPNPSSKACLSCHDGTVALDNFGGRTTGTNFISGNDNLGTNLANDHPISFAYDATLAGNDGGLYDPTTKTVTALGGTIDAKMLIGHNLECGSCHDVHRDKGDSPTAGKLLLVNNTSSALCLACHIK